MTPVPPGPGSAERAAAEVLAGRVDLDDIFGGGWTIPPSMAIAFARRLAVANLLAVPVPAAGGDEVEAVAQRMAVDDKWDWGEMTPLHRQVYLDAAGQTVDTLAPYRAAQVAAAEERGRRAGLAEAAASIEHHRVPAAVTGENAATAIASYLRRLAGEDATTTSDEGTR